MKNCHIKFLISICFIINSIFPRSEGDNITKPDYDALRVRFMESEGLNKNNYNFSNEIPLDVDNDITNPDYEAYKARFMEESNKNNYGFTNGIPYGTPTPDFLLGNNAIGLCTRHGKQFEPDLLDIIIKSAPVELRKIAEMLKDKTIDNRVMRSIIPQIIVLEGEPGVGKTTLAQAIAQYCNMGCMLIKITDLYDKFKDSGSHNLREIFSMIRAYSDPLIIILDEMQCLVKKRNQEEKDDDAAQTLWSALDEFEDNPNLFFIGTANSIKNLPPQLLSRISTTVYTINSPSYETRKKIISYYLMRAPAYMNYQLNKQEYISLIKKTRGLTHRELHKVFNKACSLACLNALDDLRNSGTITLRLIHIENAIEIVKKSKNSNSWVSTVYEMIKPHINSIAYMTVPVIVHHALCYYI